MVETVQEFNPYLHTLFWAVMNLLGGLLVVALFRVRGYVEKWMKARMTEAQRQVVHKLAKEAFSLAEQAYKASPGPVKLEQAKAYLRSQLAQKGIKFDDEQMQAVIETHVADYNALVKGAIKAADPIVVEVAVPVSVEEPVENT